MKFFILLICLSQLACATTWDELTPLLAHERFGEPRRLIEPTSPVLGRELVKHIRNDNRRPEIIFQELVLNHEPFLSRDLILSTRVYVNTLRPSLEEFCSGQKAKFLSPKYTLMEHAAIPLEVLMPHHDDYANRLVELERRDESIDISIIQKEAREFQNRRNKCDAALKLEEMENKAKRFSPGRYDRLIDLNHRVSAAEGSFPRVQYAVNGFTQFVYDELFQIEDSRLKHLLATVHDSFKSWLDTRRNQENNLEIGWIKTAEINAQNAGFFPREILLALAYSTRNMPSLDVHYAHDPIKSLLLEVYFWKIRDLRNEVSAKYLDEVFPNHVFEKNPGVYHYLTASFLACEIKLNGYSTAMARSMALASKIGYKSQKILVYIFDPKVKDKSLKSIRETAQKQAMGEGIEAGRYGGHYGTKICGKRK